MKRFHALVACILLSAFALSACGGSKTVPNAGQQALNIQQSVSNNAVSRVGQTEPPPILYDSSDAHNQRIFYTIQSDPNKIEYLELVGLDGTPYAHFTIKGQVSSMNTQETNPSQMQCKDRSDNQSYSISCVPIGLAEPNGVYQGTDAGHFAISTSGGMIEWQGDFVTSDQPFTISAPVKMQLNENVAPTPTSLAHVSGGVLPTRTP